MKDEFLLINFVFRQMDLTIVCILAAKLEIKYPLPDELIGKCMGLLEFR